MAAQATRKCTTNDFDYHLRLTYGVPGSATITRLKEDQGANLDGTAIRGISGNIVVPESAMGHSVFWDGVKRAENKALLEKQCSLAF